MLSKLTSYCHPGAAEKNTTRTNPFIFYLGLLFQMKHLWSVCRIQTRFRILLPPSGLRGRFKQTPCRSALKISWYRALGVFGCYFFALSKRWLCFKLPFTKNPERYNSQTDKMCQYYRGEMWTLEGFRSFIRVVVLFIWLFHWLMTNCWR